MAKAVADEAAAAGGRGAFPHLVVAAAVVAGGLVAAVLLMWATASDSDRDGRRTFEIERLEEGATPLLVDGRSLFLVRDGDEVWAIEPVTPHLGQPIWWCDEAKQFFDPVHGSIFDMDGVKLGGPARHGLDRYHVEVEDGLATVDVGRQIAGQPLRTRSVRPTPSRSGFFCSDPVEPLRAPPR